MIGERRVRIIVKNVGAWERLFVVCFIVWCELEFQLCRLNL